MRTLALLSVLAALSSPAAAAAIAPKVHVDCKDHCDADHLRVELTLVELVRDRRDAEVQIQILEEDAAGGGHRFTADFVGQGRFAGTSHAIVFTQPAAASADAVRKAIAGAIKTGLSPYLVKSGMADRLTVQFAEESGAAKPADRWNHWTMTTRLQAMFDGQSSGGSSSVNGGFSADRVTPALKMSVGANGSWSRNSFRIGDEQIVSANSSRGVSALVVKSLGEHWSAGASGFANRSTHDNTALSAGVQPAVEYNVFPYSQSTTRQLRVKYQAGPSLQRYLEETVHGKTSETLLDQSVTVVLDLKKKWGTFQASPYWHSYLNDVKSGSAGIASEVSLNVAKGLALDFTVHATSLRGQRSLAARDASRDEVLLKSRQLASSFTYWAMAGFRYTFGSRNDAVVNPRFGR